MRQTFKIKGKKLWGKVQSGQNPTGLKVLVKFSPTNTPMPVSTKLKATKQLNNQRYKFV